MFKKILIFVTLLAAAALVLALPAWPGSLPVSIIPDGARWVAHLDVEKFVATKFFEYLEKDGRLVIKNQDLTQKLHIDPFKDIKSVTVFGMGPGEKQAVFAVAGRFDKTRLLALLDIDEKHKEIAYGGATIHVTGDGQGAFINDGLIVYSESQPAIEKVLDTVAGKARDFSSSKLNAAFRGQSAGSFLTGVLEDLGELGTDIKRSKVVDLAKGLFFTAQEKGDSFRISLQATANSEENGKNLADIVQGFAALGRMSRSEDRQAIPAFLIDGLQVKVEGKAVRLELNMPSRELAELASRGKHLSFLD